METFILTRQDKSTVRTFGCELDGKSSVYCKTDMKRILFYSSTPFAHDNAASYLAAAAPSTRVANITTRVAVYAYSKTPEDSPYVEEIVMLLMRLSYVNNLPMLNFITEASISLDFSGEKPKYTISNNGDVYKPLAFGDLLGILKHFKCLWYTDWEGTMTKLRDNPLRSILFLHENIGASDFVIAQKEGLVRFDFFPKLDLSKHGNVYELMGVDKGLGVELEKKYGVDDPALLSIASMYPSSFEQTFQKIATLCNLDPAHYRGNSISLSEPSILEACVSTLNVIAKKGITVDIDKYISYISRVQVETSTPVAQIDTPFKISVYYMYILDLSNKKALTEENLWPDVITY